MQTESAHIPECEAPKGSKYHPLFSFDADVVLASRDGVLFCVPSMTLKMTSSWFRTILHLVSFDTEIITLDEDSSTLEALFRMICGLEIPALDAWDAVEPVLFAAEKYDMPGPASIMRALLRTPTFFRARIAEAPFLTDAQLSDTAAARCSRCREAISYFEWRELRHSMLSELERRPAGDTVLTGLEEWPTAQACWASKCKKLSCLSPVYDKVLSSKAIKDVLDSLPNAVEVPVYETA
ncbi:hypothetical protein BJV77DRAFT_999080 [Russula vinacea]|nr:hypothetical protein BJV77DRAFT_999080 [Russula vinacea]